MPSLDLNLNTNLIPGGTSVLVVDDEAGIRELCQMFLESRDYQVDLAGDGYDALKAFRKKDYDLLVTDHLMPRLNGLELMRQLRGSGNDVPAILISGNMPVGESDLRRLFRAESLLTKPFSMAQFLTAVDLTLSTSPTRKPEIAVSDLK